MPKILFFTNHKRGLLSSLDCQRGVAFLAHGNAHIVGINCSGSIIQPLPSSDWSSLRKIVAEKFGDSSPTEAEYEPGQRTSVSFCHLRDTGTSTMRLIRPLAITRSSLCVYCWVK